MLYLFGICSRRDVNYNDCFLIGSKLSLHMYIKQLFFRDSAATNITCTFSDANRSTLSKHTDCSTGATAKGSGTTKQSCASTKAVAQHIYARQRRQWLSMHSSGSRRKHSTREPLLGEQQHKILTRDC